MLTFLWWAATIVPPAVVACRAMRRGRRAMGRGDYMGAEMNFERAANHPSYRQKALCQLAKAALQSQQPQKALLAIDRLFDQAMPPNDRQPLFLRALACLALREGHTALEIMARYAERSDASVEERLAMVHACILVEDFDAAGVFLTMIPEEQMEGPLRARWQLCQAAIHYHQGRWEQLVRALPAEDDCNPDDRVIVQQLRIQLADKPKDRDDMEVLCPVTN